MTEPVIDFPACKVVAINGALYARPRKKSERVELLRALKSLAANAAEVRSNVFGVQIPIDLARKLSSRSQRNVRLGEDAKRHIDLRVSLEAEFGGALEAVKKIREMTAEEAAALIADSKGLDVLDDHQKVNVAAMTVPGGPGLCVFDEQGAGKTVSAIYAFDLLFARNLTDRVLIVAPKSMIPEWPKDFDTFLGGLHKCEIIAGTRAEKKKILSGNAEVLVTNFETVVSMGDDLKAVMRAARGRFTLIVDESFFIKSPDARRTQGLVELREWATRTFVLCGTPAPNAPHDIVAQVGLVDFGKCFEGVKIPKEREEALPIISEAVEARGLYIRNLKDDVLPDLPSKRFQTIKVPLTGAQHKIYQDIKSDYVAELHESSDEDIRKRSGHFLARRSALLQACSNPQAVGEMNGEIPAKFRVLDKLISEQVVEKGEKLVLWSFYTGSIQGLMDRYGHHGAVRYDGTVSDVKLRREAVRRFQDDDEVMVFIANPAAAGAGLTLHRSCHAIYESMSNQAAHYLQSVDRIHRRGQTREANYTVLICQNTLEEIEYDRILKKERSAQQLLGDPAPRSITRQTLLSEVGVL